MSEEKFHKEDERFDGMFRSSLGEMRTEPSAGGWNKLSRKLLRSEMLRFNFTNFPAVFWGIIPAAIIITCITIYFSSVENTSVSEPPVDKETIALVQEESRVDDVNDVNNVNMVNTITKDPTPPLHHSTTAPQHQVTTDTTPTTAPQHQVTTDTTPTTAPQHHSTTDTTTPQHQVTTDTIPTTAPQHHGTTDTALITPPVQDGSRQKPSREPLLRSLDMGINITPDMVFYDNTSGSFKYNYTVDFGTRYNLGRFYIQSGAGLMYSSDIGDYAISYLKNDSVGFYYTINSYTIDPGHPEDPLFETKQVTVYDSVQYLYDYSTKNKYYYIHIPLNAGYRIIDRSAWRLSVEAGLFYTCLVSVNEPAPVFYIPEGRILDIERRTPKRNNHSLGLTGGISVEYQFAKNFFLLIEPTFKYYLQAIEESSSIGIKQPYSIGLRAGIWYRLHFKNKKR